MNVQIEKAIVQFSWENNSPTVEAVANYFAVSIEDLDSNFGVMPSPPGNQFLIVTNKTIAERIQKEFEGIQIFSDPPFQPFEAPFF